LQSHGAQAAPAGHSGQLQTQGSGRGVSAAQTPSGQFSPTRQTIGVQPQPSAVSPRQLFSSLCSAQASTGSADGGPQLQSHGGGHGPPATQSSGQAQVQVFGPPPPSRQLGGGWQSQAQDGQSAPSGQTSGQAQAQPSLGCRVQKPPSTGQEAPGGQRRSIFATQSQVGSAVQLASSACARQASIAWQTPEMQAAPSAHAMPSGIHWHVGSAPQILASPLSWQGSPTR